MLLSTILSFAIYKLNFLRQTFLKHFNTTRVSRCWNTNFTTECENVRLCHIQSNSL